MTTRLFRTRLVLISALACTAGASMGCPAWAGPAKYDPDTGQFFLTYMYHAAPGRPIPTGAPQNPSDQQDKEVRGLIEDVSRTLNTVTEGRAKIGNLSRVDNVNRADIVVDLVNDSDRVANATVGPVDAAGSGQVIFYFRKLSPRTRTGVIWTVTHELCHYLFGLPDEYLGAGSPFCPNQNRAETGCLMDNYWPFQEGGRGWYGRLCTGDHAKGVQFNGQVIADSCETIMKRFFDRRPPRPGIPGQPAATATTTATASDPGEVKFYGVIQNAISEVSKRVKSALGSNVVGDDRRSRVREIAGNVINELLKNAGISDRAQPEIEKAIETVVGQTSRLSVGVPDRLKDLQQLLTERAVTTSRLFAALSVAERAIKISTQLFNMLNDRKQAIGAAPLSAEEQDFVFDLAHNAARSVTADRSLATDVGGVQFLYARETLDNLIAVGEELNVPGTESRIAEFRRLESQSDKFSLPHPNYPRFGRRRTMILAPDPSDPRTQYVPIRSGFQPYSEIRDRYIDQFTRLVERTKIELIRPSFAETAAPMPLGPAEGANQPPAKAPAAGAAPVSPEGLLKDVIGQIRRNRLENIMLLVPPDGFDLNLTQSLRDLSAQVIGPTDVRFDIVLIGSSKVPKELRDLAVRSGGVILTITDVHEVGALAQRLRNEQASGAWVTIPRQGSILFPNLEKPKDALPPEELPKDELKRRLNQDQFKYQPKLEDVPKDGAKPTEHITFIERLVKIAVPAIDDLIRLDEVLKTKVATGIGPARSLLEDFRRDINQIGDSSPDGNKPLNHLSSELGKGSPDQAAVKRSIVDLINAVGRARKSLAAARYAIRDRQDLLTEGNVADGKNRVGFALTTMSLVIQSLEEEVLATLPYLPIFKRLDLEKQKAKVEEIEKELHTGISPRSSVKAPTRFESVEFWAEEGAEFELIIGLSHVPDVKELVAPQEVLKLTVTDVNGRNYDARLDYYASTPTVRVYRLRPRVPEGGILLTANLDGNSECAKELFEWDIVNYTFSIASARPNVQLIETLRQEVPTPEDNKPSIYRGSVRFDESNGVATIETQVYGGAPIVDAKVFGIYQRITTGLERLEEFPRLDFVDDGTKGDRVANDGTYTAQIVLADKDRGGEGAEYRVVIAAISTDKSAIVPFELGLLGTTTPAGATTAPAAGTTTAPTAAAGSNAAKSEKKPGSALRFERATTIHFRVRPDLD